MYTMKADGVVFYDPSSQDMTLQVLSPRAKLELNKAGSLEFSLPIFNKVYSSLQKLKTIVTLESNGTEIFRGRVLSTETDLYGQKNVYCEGELGYLLDSLVRPYEFSGKASDLFRQLVAQHNEQVDDYKQFQIGTISAITDEDEVETESEAYTSTYAELRQMLVTKFGGYLMVSMSGSTRYLHYLDEPVAMDGEALSGIMLGTNLVDIEDKYEAGDVFSVLVPLGGYNTKHKDAITIAEANGGLDYIESATAIAKYGRIVKTYKWEELTDPQEILEKGQEQLAKMEEVHTLTIKAFDLKTMGYTHLGHVVPGRTTLITAGLHGYSNTKEICSAADIDIEQPDQSEYTFGIPPETLTDNNASVQKQTQDNSGWLAKLKEWLTVTDTELTIAKQHISENGDTISNVLLEMDAMNATILLKADQTVVTDLETRVSNAEILIDGANAAIDLKADRTTVTDLETRMSAAEILIDGANAEIALKAAQVTVDDLSERLSQAEIDIDGANAAISLKASQSTVDSLGERVTAAELLIDGQNSTIAAKADLILLDGYVKTTDLEAGVLEVLESANIYSLTATTVNTYSLNVSGDSSFNSLSVSGLTVDGEYMSTSSLTMGSVVTTEVWTPSGDIDLSHSHSVTVNGDGTVTLGEVSSTGGSFNMADTAFYKDAVSAAKKDGQDEGYELGYADAKPTGLSIKTSTYSSDTKVYSVDVEVLTADEQGYHYYISVDGTDAYNAGYSSGEDGVTLSAAGWVGGVNVVSASNGESVNISLPAFSTSGGDTFSDKKTTVYFYTDSVNGYLASKEVDASSVYTSGFNSGYSSGYTAGQASIDTGEYYDDGYDSGYSAGYSAGYQAAKDAVVVTAGMSFQNYPAQYYARFRYWGKATIDGEEVGSASGYQSYNVSGAM